MQNYKYKIRHETEYLLRMRNSIMTNYRSAGELGPFLPNIPPSDLLEMLTQKCLLIITRLRLPTWSLSNPGPHTNHPAQEGAFHLHLISATLDLLLHLSEYLYHVCYTSSIVGMWAENKRPRGFSHLCHLDQPSASSL